MTRQNPKNSGWDSWVSDQIISIFWTASITILALLIVSIVSFGTLFEIFSNPVLGLFGMRIGLTPSILGVGTLWGIASGGLAYIIAESIRYISIPLYDSIPNQVNELVPEKQAKLVGNVFIAIIVVPFTIVILTTVAATQINTVEVLWEVLMVGYSGAIIGAYSETISNVVPNS